MASAGVVGRAGDTAPVHAVAGEDWCDGDGSPDVDTSGGETVAEGCGGDDDGDDDGDDAKTTAAPPPGGTAMPPGEERITRAPYGSVVGKSGAGAGASATAEGAGAVEGVVGGSRLASDLGGESAAIVRFVNGFGCSGEDAWRAERGGTISPIASSVWSSCWTRSERGRRKDGLPTSGAGPRRAGVAARSDGVPAIGPSEAKYDGRAGSASATARGGESRAASARASLRRRSRELSASISSITWRSAAGVDGFNIEESLRLVLDGGCAVRTRSASGGTASPRGLEGGGWRVRRIEGKETRVWIAAALPRWR